MWWWWLASCEEPDAPPVRTPPPAPAEACATDPDNVLRIVCAWSRARTGPVAVRIAERDIGSTRELPGAEDALDVRIVVWDLLADTDYDWALVEDGRTVDQGTLRTPPLPEDVELFLDTTIDGPTSIDRVLLPAACGSQGHLVALDGQGRVRWYQATSTANALTAIDASDRGTVLALLGRTGVREWALDGTVVRTATHPDQGLDRLVHHAVVGRNGRTYVLDTRAFGYPDGRSYLMDGVSVAGEGHVWGLDEVIVDPSGFDPPPVPSYWGPTFPAAVDFAHENGLHVDPDGRWLLTFKHLDTLVELDPDGQVAWAITGGDGPVPFPEAQLALGSSVGLEAAFEHPHTPTRSPWGTVLMMDNGLVGDASRVVELAVDLEAGTADLVRAWELGASCPVQSSVVALEDGTVLAACTRSQEIFELDDDGIRRRSTVRCRNGNAPGTLARVAPITL